VHSDIATYFREVAIELDGEFPKWRWEQKRSLSELPHHQLSAGMWNALEKTLTDISFVEAKSRTGMVYDLIRDYAAAERAWPGQEEERRREDARQRCMQGYVDALIAYSRAHTARREGRDVEIPPLPVPPPSVARTSEPEVAEISREWTPIERVRVWEHFVSNHTVDLISGQEPAFQIAYNSADSGPVADTLEDRLRRGFGPSVPWVRLINRPPFLLHPMCLKMLEGHTDRITAVAVTPDGQWAITGGWDRRDYTLRVWNLKTGQSRSLQGHTEMIEAVAVTPDRRRVVSAAWHSILCVSDLETGQFRALKGHTGDVKAVAMTPDGRRAVSASDDKTLRVWNLETGQSSVLEGHTSSVTAVAVTPDGLRAVSGSYDHSVRVWNLETGQSRVLDGHTSSVSSVAVTPGGRRAISGSSDNTLRVWDLETGQSRVLDGHTCPIYAVTLTADGRCAVSTSADETMRVWDLKTGHSRILHGRVGAVAITPDGRRAVSSGPENMPLRLWNLEMGYTDSCAPQEQFTWVHAVAVTPDGQWTISGGWKSLLYIRNLETGHSRALPGRVSAIAVTPDGRRAVSGSDDKTMRVWDLETGHFRVLEGHTGNINVVAVTPDGRGAVSGSDDKTTRVWDLETGHFREFQGVGSAIAMMPDGRRAVSASDDETLRVWNLETGQSRVLKGDYVSFISSVAVTPDGRRAISASGYQLYVIDLETSQIRVIQGHWVTSVVVTPDGRRAVCARRAFSVDEDRNLHVCDLETWENVAIYTPASGHFFWSVAQRFPMLVAGTSRGRVDILRLEGARHGATLPLLGPRIITPVRLWFCGPGVTGGRWDDALTVLCDACGQRLPAPAVILDTIAAITRTARIGPHDSPYLSLPAEAWDEPRLVSECPLCHEPLKFNPFVVDNRDRYPAP
jgi:WD40 repeat protein